MKTKKIVAIVALAMAAAHYVQAVTYTFANSNVDGSTPTTPLDWLTQATWTTGAPVSGNGNTVQFFEGTTTLLANTGASGNSQTANLNNSGAAFELGVLTLSGKASATTGANLTETLSGDPLNFSALTGTINLDGVNNTRILAFNLNNAIQLGTTSSTCALTLTGAGTGTFTIGGAISELQTGGGSLVKSGTSTVTLSGANTYSGSTTINVGVLNLTRTNALQNSASVSVASGATLQVNAQGTFANTATATIVGTGAGTTPNPGAILFRGNFTNTWNAPITLGGTTTISGFGAYPLPTLNGAINGTGPLTINAKGGDVNTHFAVWTLHAASTYSGNTTILNNDGYRDFTVKLGVDNALPPATSLNLQAVVGIANSNQFVTLDLNGHSQTLAGLTDTGSSLATGSGTVGKRVINSSGTPATLTINNAGDITYGTTGTRTLPGTLGGKTTVGVDANNLSLSKTGAGTLTLAGTNTYSGETSISQGTLKSLNPLPQLGGKVVNVLLNPSFEADAGIGDYFNKQPVTNWTWSGSAPSANTYIEQGLSTTFAPSKPPSYDATSNFKWAVIQQYLAPAGTVQSLSQTFNIATAGVYNVGFAAAGRNSQASLNLIVKIDGIAQSAPITPSVSAWNTYSSSNVFLTAGSHTLAFECITLGNDRSDVLDSVTIRQPTVSISAGATLDVASQANFSMEGHYVLDVNGTQAGSIIADGLTIDKAYVKVNTQNLSSSAAWILATYTNLTGSAFAAVTDLPPGYRIDYNYKNAKQIALVPPGGTVFTIY